MAIIIPDQTPVLSVILISPLPLSQDSFRARLTTDGQGIRIVPKPPSIKRKPNVIEEEVVTSSDEDDR